jgi:acyl-CoA hydrolase
MIKTPNDSIAEIIETMRPRHANPTWDSVDKHIELGNVNGGAILNLIDNAAGLAAIRHCRSRVVTASMDEMHFLNPVKVGELLILKARVNYVGRTSLEVGVHVVTENLSTGVQKTTGTALLTFVCLDDKGRPKQVPPMDYVTDEDKLIFEEAKNRVQLRKERRSKRIKK